MILCDIGNSFFHFFENGKMWRESAKSSPKIDIDKKIFYISVNSEATDKLLSVKPDAIDLEPYCKLDTVYQGLGIDRVLACIGVIDGVVCDAGSAITIDVMQNGVHLGGYILPGISSYREFYKNISSRLDANFNLSVELDMLPQNTKDAISYGAISSILCSIRQNTKNKKISFTGGDGKFLSRFFPESVYDETIIFKAMRRVIEKNYL